MALVTTTYARQTPAISRIDYSGDPLLPGKLEYLLDDASLKAEHYCGRPFELKSYSEVLNGTGLNQLFLTVTPLFEIEQVDIVDPIDRTTTTYLLADDAFDFEEATGQIRFKDLSLYFTAGFQNVTVTYTGGYYDIPTPVQDAVCMMVLQIASQGSSSADLALGANSSGDYSYTHRQMAMTDGIYTPAVKNLLEQYRTMGSGLLTAMVNVIGPQGALGLLAFRGPQGYQGFIGVQGYTGVQGIVGAQGFQGIQGIQGVQGGQGVQGVQGAQGLEGNQGFQGFQGAQGRQGTQGTQGNQGAQGVQGWQGWQGRQGRTGFQGFQGTQGAEGAQGYPGEGFQGFQGWQGT
jgi:hypothetical protein